MNQNIEAVLSVNAETANRIDQARALVSALVPVARPDEQGTIGLLKKGLDLLQGDAGEQREALFAALRPLLKQLAADLAPSDLSIATLLKAASAAYESPSDGAPELVAAEKSIVLGPYSNGKVFVFTSTGVRMIECDQAWGLRDLCWPMEGLMAAYPENKPIRELGLALMGLDPEETAERLRCKAGRVIGEMLPMLPELKDSLPEIVALMLAAKPALEAIATMTIPDDMFEGPGAGIEMAAPVYHAAAKQVQMQFKGDFSSANLASDGGKLVGSQGGAFLKPGKRNKAALPESTELKLWKQNPSPFAPTPEVKPAKPDPELPPPPSNVGKEDKASKVLESFAVKQLLESSPPNSMGLLAVVQMLHDSGAVEAANELEKRRLGVELLYQKTIASIKGATVAATETPVAPKEDAAKSAPLSTNAIASAAFAKAFEEDKKEAAPAAAPDGGAEPELDIYKGMTPLVKHVLQKKIPMYKADEERFVLGVVLEPETIDAQDDIISEETIRNAAHKFMEEFQNLGLQHQFLVNGAVKILESYIAPADFKAGDQTIRKGTWVLAVRVVDDKLWNMVKNNQLTGFSIGGMAYRFPEAGQAAAA